MHPRRIPTSAECAPARADPVPGHTQRAARHLNCTVRRLKGAVRLADLTVGQARGAAPLPDRSARHAKDAVGRPNRARRRANHTDGATSARTFTHPQNSRWIARLTPQLEFPSL